MLGQGKKTKKTKEIIQLLKTMTLEEQYTVFMWILKLNLDRQLKEIE